MKALLLVDLQNDFMPGGPLGVPGADELAPLVNALMPLFSCVVASLDWHPLDHVSFAANHLGKHVGDRVDVGGESQILWPVHCVQKTRGAALVSALDTTPISHLAHKGCDSRIDSYSAFFDNAHERATGLGDYLKERGVTDLFLVGVATDYCVLYSCLDALSLGFRVFVIVDACRGIDLHAGDVSHALEKIAAAGGNLLTINTLKEVL
jgi:nicotinamidase/pyrazinamidase